MQQRIRRVALLAVASALLVLALPLGWALRSALFAAQRSELQRVALTAAAAVSPDFVAGDAVELPATPASGTSVALYDASARRRAGAGPASADAVTIKATRGVPSDAAIDGELVVAVPVSAGERTIGVVRAASSLSALGVRVLLAWLVLLAAVGVAFCLALYVSRRQARSLAAPLEELASASRAVTDGDLSARARPAGVPEIDEVARAQNVMIDRLLALLRRERALGPHIAHQLRTPLTRLQLILQADSPPDREHEAPGRGVADRALAEIRTLQTAVDDLLAAAGPPATWTTAVRSGDLGAVLDDLAQRWRGTLAERSRQLRMQISGELDGVLVPVGVTRQVLDVLLDNATRHGRGTVSVRARDAAGSLALDVEDEGALDDEQNVMAASDETAGAGSGHGIGLVLASDLASSAGGRLVLSRRRPTMFTVFLPGTPEEASPGPLAGADGQQHA